MAASQEPTSFSPGNQVQVAAWDQDPLPTQQRRTPRKPSPESSVSSFSFSSPVKRRSVPYRGFSPVTTVFTPTHRRYESVPIVTTSRTDPKSAFVYKWLDNIEKAGGVQPLDNLPFQPPPDIKYSDSKPRSPETQPKLDLAHWEDAIEEEGPETPTDIVDSQAVNLGITMSGETAMTQEWPEMGDHSSDPSKPTPTKISTTPV